MTEENNQESAELSVSELSEQTAIRRQKLLDLQERGLDPFLEVKYEQTAHSAEIHGNFDELCGKEVSLAGRMMTKRLMGKASFSDLLDRDGRIQVYIRKDEIGEEAYNEYKKWDIGDIIGVKGEVFRTQKGEISVKAAEVKLLSKSLAVLPEKYHGLKDMEIRYRQRYVDLIVNDESREVFVKRTKIVREIRNFLDGRGFLEVETPVLEGFAGGAAARPFKTHHNALDEDMFLRISLELPLKRLIIGGLERVYEMAKVFRNEGIDTMHNPEFTMLELYQAYTDYEGMMELSESMFREVAMKVCGTMKFEFRGQMIDLEPPFERITMTEAVKRHAGVDFSGIRTTEEARAAADKLGVKYEKRDERGNILNHIFEEYAEDKLIQPCFLTDHPVEISPLTKKKPGDPRHVERFEIFICGGEFGNAYSELNDPIDQLSRFEFQEKMRAAGDDEANMIDKDFITAMEYGMPPTGGLGVGVERFIMLLTQSTSIRDIILFPTLKKI